MLATRSLEAARAKSMRPPHHTRTLNVRTREANEQAEGKEEVAEENEEEEEEEKVVVVGVEKGDTVRKGRAIAPLETTSEPCQQVRVSCKSVSISYVLIDAFEAASLFVAS